MDGVEINLRNFTKCRRKVLEGHKSIPSKKHGSAEALRFREKANLTKSKIRAGRGGTQGV